MFEGNKTNSGWIELICGSMFSGKTSELQRRIRRANIAGLKCISFKHEIDHRFHPTNIVSHDQYAIEAISLSSTTTLLDLAGSYDVIAIDEAQFFDEDIVNICNTLANSGKRVIVAGLDRDSNARSFGSIPELMAQAEYVTKLHAICVHCGSLAHYTTKIKPSKDQIEVGAADKYEAKCRACYLQETKK